MVNQISNNISCCTSNNNTYTVYLSNNISSTYKYYVIQPVSERAEARRKKAHPTYSRLVGGLRTARGTWTRPQRKEGREIRETTNLYLFLAEKIKSGNFERFFDLSDKLKKEESDLAAFIVSYPFVGPRYIYQNDTLSKLFKATILPLVNSHRPKANSDFLPIAWMRANVLMKYLYSCSDVDIHHTAQVFSFKNFVIINLTAYKMSLEEREKGVDVTIESEDEEDEFRVCIELAMEVQFMFAYTLRVGTSSSLQVAIAETIEEKTVSRKVKIKDYTVDDSTGEIDLGIDIDPAQEEEVNSISSSVHMSKLVASNLSMDCNLYLGLVGSAIKVYRCGVEVFFYFNCEEMTGAIDAFNLKDYADKKEIYFWGGFDQEEGFLAFDSIDLEYRKVSSVKSENTLDIRDTKDRPVSTFRMLEQRYAGLLLSQFVSRSLITPPNRVKKEGILALYKVQRFPEAYVLFKEDGDSSMLYTRERCGWLHTYPCELYDASTKKYVFDFGTITHGPTASFLNIPNERTYLLQKIELESEEAESAGVEWIISRQWKKELLSLTHITPVDTAIGKAVREAMNVQPQFTGKPQFSALVNAYLTGYSI